MLKNKLKYILILVLILIASCAKRGSIDGGIKDTIAPVLKMSLPKNYSTNFKGNTIKLTFNEYVEVKDANKQLIISPPVEKAPQISPQTASKTITITFNDSLQANTTYSLNFGKSIKDFNEGNPYQQFKYVFSTGSYIDSLSLSGIIKDSYEKKTDAFVSVMLYEMNSKYTDSTVYKENPRYITNTLDSATTFKLENLKAGKYQLIALKDENNNNKYNSITEKIAFHKEIITIPNDTLFELALFKEQPTFKASKPSQGSGNRAIMGYEGDVKDLKLTLKKQEELIPLIITKFQEKDSVQLWYKNNTVDSLRLNVTKGKYAKDFVFNLKKQKNDTLVISPKQSKILSLRENFILKSTIPLVKFDTSKMQLINKDSTAIAFKIKYNEWDQELAFDFKKEPLEKYKIKLFPGALEDYLEHQNDTLIVDFETKNVSDYGNLRLKLENIKQFPIIIELTNAKGDVLASEYSESSTNIEFNLIEPNLFTLRVIYDENKNKVRDAGNFLEKKQSEEVIYFPKEIDVRANWDVEQTFNLKP
ncbi:Ig-like domain-containing protein [Flavobacterium myungsuense]|uniref:Ig-like domain-containing protein n=1 Tax=Flavobacterium myungsuense TaxID=651823 RepID=A0ABW3IYY9_9FLAO